MSLFSSRTRRAANCATQSAAYATRSAGQDIYAAGDQARSIANDLQSDVGHSISRTKGRARRFIRDVRDDIENSADYVSGQIRNNPARSLLILLSAGFLLGAALTRRSD